MLSLEYSINEDKNKNEIHNKSNKSKICFGILILLIILFIIILTISIIFIRSELKESIKNIAEENYNFKLTINNIDNEKNDLKKIKEEINNYKNELKQIIEKLDNEKIIQLQIAIEKLNDENKQLKNEIDKLNIKNNELKIISNESNNKIIGIENEKNQLKNITINIEKDKEKLENITNKIKEENDELKNNINELKKTINRIDDKQYNLEYRIDEIEDEKNERNKYYIDLFTDSKVIKKEERKLISKWILPHYNLKFKLIYSGSKDGFKNQTFHSKCDSKGPTLFVAKLENNKRIGGFTSASWDQREEGIIDNNAFLFSLDKKIKYGLKQKGKWTIYGHPLAGIIFGPNCDEGVGNREDDLHMIDQILTSRDHGVKFNFDKDDLCGNNRIKMIEFEVYSVKNYNQ